MAFHTTLVRGSNVLLWVSGKKLDKILNVVAQLAHGLRIHVGVCEQLGHRHFVDTACNQLHRSLVGSGPGLLTAEPQQVLGPVDFAGLLAGMLLPNLEILLPLKPVQQDGAQAPVKVQP